MYITHTHFHPKPKSHKGVPPTKTETTIPNVVLLFQLGRYITTF